ncbi:protein trichome birefringence-like 19 [Heracleum sosnowskyi]|uniref:Protein trichome birefringence-like 19 n=1 Tax=Heracleum sosnowskyi TaxID=360622 RepID=A0AAD8HYY3_9APIA|nr:protein trichome birefringence-like 19 [Heracleum sosnowskyi]
MKLQNDTTVILFSKSPTRRIPQTTLLLIAFTIILTITSVCHPSLQNSIIRLSRSISQFSLSTNIVNETVVDERECDLFKGQWVRNRMGPYYTNETCSAIQEHQNCMKNGRPDVGYTKWRWQPDGCNMEVFDPVSFLSFMRGKSLAFVGDSVARNHVQSLICLLSKVTHPIEASNDKEKESRRWEYKDYNFNMSIFWSPYLVRTQKTDPNDVTRPFNLYLDEFDRSWTSEIKHFDYVIISAAQWFFRPSMYYVRRRLVGCLYCSHKKIAKYPAEFGYRLAYRTALKAINTVKKYKGVTYFRTYAPSHFENGKWDKGGNCPRKRPYSRNRVALDDYNLKINNIQLEEFTVAENIGRRKGLRFGLLNVTHVMLLRPDGHPNKYGHGPDFHKEGLANDCVHWCLPGPIDTWNDFLLEMIKRDSKMGRSSNSFYLH